MPLPAGTGAKSEDPRDAILSTPPIMAVRAAGEVSITSVWPEAMENPTLIERPLMPSEAVDSGPVSVQTGYAGTSPGLSILADVARHDIGAAEERRR